MHGAARSRSVPINTLALLEFMKLSGFNGTTLAKNAQISPPYLSQILNGHRHPSPAVVKRLADALGIRAASLFSSVGQRSAAPERNIG